MKNKLVPILLSLVFLLSACGAPAKPATLKIAVLPIIDTLPMYVAQQEGLFAKHGVNVEFVSVASAPERDQILAAGQADGTINETLAVMLFNRESAQMQVVRYALRPTEGHGHFFIIASGHSGITSVDGLRGVEIGVSQGTVIEYVTERLLQAEGFSADEIKTIAVPKIPDRMALLVSGELKAGVMPDPLASLVVAQGGVIVADDSTYPEYGFSVISFRKAVIDENSKAVEGFPRRYRRGDRARQRRPCQIQESPQRTESCPCAITGCLPAACLSCGWCAHRSRMAGCVELAEGKRDAGCGCLVCGFSQRLASSLADA
jgi:NitT/TauT family transport system substrate-binding protein